MKKKTWLIIIPIVLAAAAVFLWPKGKGQENLNYTEHTVGRGDIEKSVAGSGSLIAQDEESFELPAGIEIESVILKNGDSVKAGDCIARFSLSSLEERRDMLITELGSLDMELMQLERNKTSKSIIASSGGRIKAIFAEEGKAVLDIIRENSALALVSLDGYMKIEVNSELTAGERLEVVWNGGKAEGFVESVSGGKSTVLFSDEKAPYGENAKLMEGDTAIAEGIIEINSPLKVLASGGIISEINVKLDAKLGYGKKLFTLEEKVLTESYKAKLEERREKEEELEEIIKYIASPEILAEKDGIVFESFLEEGKPTGSAAYSLYTGGAVRMNIMVDELDMGSVSEGQEAVVVLDAFSNERFSAKVERISKIGKPSMSITEYEAELILSYDERLLIGMNGNASIDIGGAENVLMIPIEAIEEDKEGSYVMVGEEKRYIKTGLSDGTYAEVISGVSEGDIIRYTKANSWFDNFAMNSPMTRVQQSGARDGGR